MVLQARQAPQGGMGLLVLRGLQGVPAQQGRRVRMGRWEFQANLDWQGIEGEEAQEDALVCQA